jgi:hypothetical protein
VIRKTRLVRVNDREGEKKKRPHEKSNIYLGMFGVAKCSAEKVIVVVG